MNTHLNIFKNYANADGNYQIENNLTRALVISIYCFTLKFIPYF